LEITAIAPFDSNRVFHSFDRLVIFSPLHQSAALPIKTLSMSPTVGFVDPGQKGVRDPESRNRQ
jgi:hypothetical protein